MGDPSSITGSGRSPGEGNGNPLQYSCLENSMDRGTWRTTVHGVTKSRTRLRDYHFTSFLFLISEEEVFFNLLLSIQGLQAAFGFMWPAGAACFLLSCSLWSTERKYGQKTTLSEPTCHLKPHTAVQLLPFIHSSGSVY